MLERGTAEKTGPQERDSYIRYMAPLKLAGAEKHLGAGEKLSSPSSSICRHGN